MKQCWLHIIVTQDHGATFSFQSVNLKSQFGFVSQLKVRHNIFELLPHFEIGFGHTFNVSDWHKTIRTPSIFEKYTEKTLELHPMDAVPLTLDQKPLNSFHSQVRGWERVE